MRFTWSVVAQRLHTISTTYYVLDVVGVVVGTTSMYHSRSHSIASTGDGTKEYYGEEESLLPLCEKLHTELRRRTIVYNYRSIPICMYTILYAYSLWMATI